MGDGSPWCDEHGGVPYACFRCVDEARAEGEDAGAAIAFGLMGMAEAIRTREPVVTCVHGIREDEACYEGACYRSKRFFGMPFVPATPRHSEGSDGR